MALFSRRRGGGDRTAAESPSPLTTLAEDTTSSAFAGDVEDDGRPQRPDTAPIGDSERARIDAALQRLEGDGVDVDDLAALGAAYDRARATGADGDVVVETIGLAIGEHLVRHARMDWALATDVFGTDLGVVARRRGTTLIPTNIVATRWLSGQTGWVPGVVGHLIRLGTG